MLLTVQEIRIALPDNLKGSASQELADTVNTLTTDPEAARTIRETFIGYTNVLKEGKFRIQDYANAAAYVSYKLMGYNNRESYTRTFQDRYMDLVAKGCTDREISAYVSVYNRGKLVNLIMEQALIPVWVLNQDAFQEAVRTQVAIMTSGKSEMVRMQAANSILTHIKPPEKKQLEIAITTSEHSGMDDLRAMLTSLALRQQEMIQLGATTKEIAHQRIVRSDDESSRDISGMIDVTPETES